MQVQDATSLLSVTACWSISHVKRDENITAHVLARSTLSLEGELIDVVFIPLCIQ